ncbi:DUF4435 domain-containing protein [Microcoleus sp. T3_A4]|uniref:DUF4435 domain-containing protein n=1 Tax=Microcoleus sp. T3_A4 TaxID=2818968 RepID=UPI002FD3FD7E
MLTRTSSGIRNTSLFYRGFYLVIVEGQDDEVFWSKFFPAEINGYKRRFKRPGGRPQVQPYIDQLLSNEVLSDELHFAVAIDSDYSFLLNSLHQHSRIIETKSHSIENLILCPFVIVSAIRNLSYDTEYEILKVNYWLSHFDQATHSLMVADLTIEKNNLQKKCVGHSCKRFLIEEDNPDFDTNKIECFIQDLNLPRQEFNEMATEVGTVKPRFHIRGHFFSDAVRHFIRHEVKNIRQKNVNLPNDAFYAMVIALWEPRIETDPMLQAMREQALSAAEEVTNLLSQEP